MSNDGCSLKCAIWIALFSLSLWTSPAYSDDGRRRFKLSALVPVVQNT